MNDEAKYKFSVVIPLYNKRHEIRRTVESALAQTYSPIEVIVVNDGSIDGSEQVVSSIKSPLLRVINQPNSGVSVARNRGIESAEGEYVALLDGDDVWDERFLEKISIMIDAYPQCGAYATAFTIESNGQTVRNSSPQYQGVIRNYFSEAMHSYICQPSTTVIPRAVFEAVGGFPEGMKLGEDQYMWVKIAEHYQICFTPEALVKYNRTASNRSAAIYEPEQTNYSFEDLYHDDGNEERNEYIARCAIGKALTISAKGDTAFGRRTERFFDYTRKYRFGWWKLRIVNRLPRRIRPWVYDSYQRLAWLIAHKGL